MAVEAVAGCHNCSRQQGAMDSSRDCRPAGTGSAVVRKGQKASVQAVALAEELTVADHTDCRRHTDYCRRATCHRTDCTVRVRAVL